MGAKADGSGAPSESPGPLPIGRVLVVEDDADVRAVLEDLLGSLDIEGDLVSSAEEGLAYLESGSYDLVLSDLCLATMDGIELCERVKCRWPKVVTVILTGHGTLDNAVAAMRAGAYDFLTKPIEPEALVRVLRRGLRLRGGRSQADPATADDPEHGILGESPAIRRVLGLVERLGNSELSVLLTGETGTGKELTARGLHAASPRRERPFVAVNCAALPAHLLESELFGHERGAFTDAREARKGLILEANGGTIFLDEIADMPLELQGKVLRILQEGKLRPVGSDQERPFDVRVIAATNRNVREAMERGEFREDLFFRINAAEIALPPLRDRGEDVLLLAERFLADATTREGKTLEGFSIGAIERLLGYHWPGNIRELRNCIQRAVVVTRTHEIVVEDLPEAIALGAGPRVAPRRGEEPVLPLCELERREILRALDVTKGNKKRAAELLGVDRSTLYRKLDRYEIQWEPPTSPG